MVGSAPTTMSSGGVGGRTSSSSSAVAFACGVAAGSALAACATSYLLLGGSSRRRNDDDDDDENATKTTDSARNAKDAAPASQSTTSKSLPDPLRAEMLSRNALYFANPKPSKTSQLVGQPRIENAKVLVVGLGGVGSHTAHMLARAGVKYIRLVDFDNVTLSSLNRHACATLADVGRPKVTVLADFLRRICPDEERLKLDARVQMYTGDKEKDGGLVDPPEGCEGWDVVIDAIDDVPTKAKLIAHFAKIQGRDIEKAGGKKKGVRTVRVVSCMGAGGKADPTRIHVSDLRGSSRDPLATAVRQKLRWLAKSEKKKEREQNGNLEDDDTGDPAWLTSCIDDDSLLAAVYSSEKTVAKLANATDAQVAEGLSEFGAMENMRVRVLPVVGTMPAIMGQSMAAVALCELGGKPFSPVGAERVGKNTRNRLFQKLKARERKIMEDATGVVPSKENQPKQTKDEQDPATGRLLPCGKHVGPVAIDVDDVEYLLCEQWRNRCSVTGDRLGTVLEFVRWDETVPARANNLVLLGARARGNWDKDRERDGDGRVGLGVDVRRKIEERLEACSLDA